MRYSQALAFTGHRPHKLGGYRQDNPQKSWVKDVIKHVITKIVFPERIIVGGALGVDTWAAEVAYELRVPFILAAPFKGQESLWPEASREYYQRMLHYAAEVVVVSPGGYSAAKMDVRNRWMIDNGEWVCAIWDGTSGGTGNAVNYARKAHKPGIRIDPRAYSDKQIQAISVLI